MFKWLSKLFENSKEASEREMSSSIDPLENLEENINRVTAEVSHQRLISKEEWEEELKENNN